MEVKLLWEGKNILGECPLWHPEEQVLYWVDLAAPLLHCLNPKTNEYKNWFLLSPFRCIGLSQIGGLVGVMERQFVRVTLPDLHIEPIVDIDVNAIFNDGKCDARGRFWVGSIDEKHRDPIGKLYCIDSLGERVTRKAENLIISNGLGWSPNNKKFYLTDTAQRKIHVYDFDLDKGEISNAKTLVTVSEDKGLPDGLAVDEAGYIWSAHWGGYCVTRYTPLGEVDRVVNLPVRNVTSCCFGGADLKTLFITSASIDFENNQDLGEYAGGLFSIDLEVAGLPDFQCEIHAS